MPISVPGPVPVTDRDTYTRLRDEAGRDKPAYSKDACERVCRARSMGHPLAYVCNYASAMVSVVDLLESVRLMDIGVGEGALSIDIDERNDMAYVTNFFGNSLSVIDIRCSREVRLLPVGRAPSGVRVSLDGRYVYVVHSGEDSIYVLDIRTLGLAAVIPLPSPGLRMDFAKNGTAYVSLHSAGKVAVVDLNMNLVVKVMDTGSGAEDVKASPRDPLIFISNQFADDITPINTNLAQPSIMNIISGTAPVGLAFTHAGRRLYCANRRNANVSVIDVFTHGEIARISVGNGPYGVASTSCGRLVAVTNQEERSLSIIDTRFNRVVSTVIVGYLPAFLAILQDK